MKNLLYILIALHACISHTSDSPIAPINVAIETFSGTHLSFSIHDITEKPDHALVDVLWCETNNKCETPFTRRYKETWLINRELCNRIKKLNKAKLTEPLCWLLHHLASDHSVRQSSETLQDDICSTW